MVIQNKFHFTGFQILNTGEEVPFNTFVYDTADEYMEKYLAEMNYAMAATETIAGVVILIYDSFGTIVRQEYWMRGNSI